MAKTYANSLRLVLVTSLVWITQYCLALTLPTLPSSPANSTLNGTFATPETFSIPDAPGFQIRFKSLGNPLDFEDCIEALTDAETQLLHDASTPPRWVTIPEELRVSEIRRAKLTLKLPLGVSYVLAALFAAGILEWGNQFGFFEVMEMELIGSRGLSIAHGMLVDPRNANSLTSPLAPDNTNATTFDIARDTSLFPIATVPGYFIQFKKHNVFLPRPDCLRALEAADTTLVYDYHQAPIGVSPPARAQTWIEGGVSFSLTPANDLTVVDAGIFVLGIMRWESLQGYVATDVIFIRQLGGPRGDFKTFGTGNLTAAGRSLS